MSAKRPLELRDLAYELQLLLGADAIVEAIESLDKRSDPDNQFGNLINYFKDSAYLHSRNLLNALTNEYLTEIGAIPSGITSTFYGQWKSALERYVTHINQARDQRGAANRVGGEHLNEQVHKLAEETERCWLEWISKTTNQSDETRLQKILDDARTSARSDKDKLDNLPEHHE